MERELSFERLQVKQARFETAIENVRSTRGNLGTADGVEHLNRFDSAISIDERLGRTEKVGRIRVSIDRKTLPTLEGHLQEVKSKILAHPHSVVYARIQTIRELFKEGGLTEEELKQAEQDTERILGNDVEQPRLIVRLSDAEREQRGKESQQLSVIALPDGQTIRTKGNIKAAVLKALLSTPDFIMRTEELTTVVYGEDNRATRSRLAVVLPRLRKELGPFGYRIEQLIPPAQRFRGETARYALKKEAEPSLPKITINLDTHQVAIGDRKMVITNPAQWATLLCLAKNTGSEINWREITRVAKEADSQVKHAAGGEAIGSLRKRLGIQDDNTIARLGPKNRARYTLNAQVEFVSEVTKTTDTQPKKEEKPRFPLIPIWLSRIEALNAVCDNPNITIEKIIKILGPSVNTGRSLNRGSALGALRMNTGRLALRIIRFGEIAEPQEKALWDKICNFVGMTGGPGVVKAFNDRLREWYARQKNLTRKDLQILEETRTVEEVEPLRLSELQAAVLGTMLLLENNGRFNLGSEGSFVFQVDEELRSIVKKLVENLPRPLIASALYNEGKIALAVADKILKGGNADEILSLQTNENISLLLLWIFYKDSEQMKEVLKDLLYLSTVPPTPEIQKGAEHTIVVFEPPTIPKVPKIEQRDPQIRQGINEYLDQIEIQSNTDLLHTAQLTRAFPHLTATFIDWIELEKRYITPKRARDGRHPVFNRNEIVLMLYVHDKRNTLNLRHARIKELKKIITEEIQKREQAKVHPQNGNHHRV